MRVFDTCNKFPLKLNCLHQLEYKKIALKAKSDSERIKSWLLKAKNEDGLYHTIYNPNVHRDRTEDRYIGATLKYFDIPLSIALNYLCYSLEIVQVDSRISSLTYFQIYSLDEVIEMPISSDGSYINVWKFILLIFSIQNLSILTDIHLLSNCRCKTSRSLILSVINSIMLEAWIFPYFSPKNSF